MKTRKLVCIVTGKTLQATADYYAKKLEKAGSEEQLHKTYICKEAKDLIVRGLTIEEIRKTLDVKEKLPAVSKDIVDKLLINEFGVKKSTVFSEITGFTNQETDPEVTVFLNNIL